MSNFISSEESYRTSFPEWLLARLTSPTRASAILGDLEELAITRNRTWFWTTYARTLLSLGWRPLTAFFAAALLCSKLLHSQGLGLFFCSMANPHYGPPLADTILLLWFLVPFAAIRYGLRDRAVQLTFTASLLTSSGFFPFFPNLKYSPSEGQAALLLLAAISILAATPWRRSLLPVAASCAVGVTLLETLDHIGAFSRTILGLHRLSPILPLLFVMLIVSVVFSRLHPSLHPRLPRPQPAGATHA